MIDDCELTTESLLDGDFSCETTEEENNLSDTLLNDKNLLKQMFMETKLNNQVNEINNIQVPNPCDKCPNNKKNNPNASGICSCSLPYFANPIR